MADRVRAFDWSHTPLGPLHAWPQSLRSAVGMCLRCPFQMAIYWGPELICIYNDAERDVLADLHPLALGVPARDLLRDSWHIVGPQLRDVMRGGPATFAENRPLSFDRRGTIEVGYFTYSYSPILNEDEQVGGVLLVTKETTARVIAEERIRALRELAERTMDAPTARQACALAAQALDGRPEFSFALVYLLDDAHSRATLVAASGAPAATRRAHETIDLDQPTAGAVALRLAGGDQATTGTFVDADQFLDEAGVEPVAHRAFAAFVGRGGGDRPAGLLVVGIDDELRFDDGCRSFVEMSAMGIGRSVAAARERESEHERAQAIVALDRARTALFSNASHELRTPLTLILGHLEQLLEREGLPETDAGQLTVMRRNALRMLRMINALLDFSRIEAGERIGTFEPTDAGRLTRDIAAMFESIAARADLAIVVDCAASPVVEIDRDAWEQIVSNLISNALKFTREGEIRVSTRPEDGHLRLTVQDTGIGIPVEERDQVFARFYRGSDPRARSHDGSGIGLALVCQLVDLHSGSIEIEDVDGPGTRISVRIPLHAPDGEDITEADNEHVGRSAALFVAEAEGWLGSEVSPTPPMAAGADDAPRVIVADDSADMRDYLARLLSPRFSVVLAVDGATARSLAFAQPPSLVISDVMMPGLDGFALVDELRRDPRTRDVPVILLSARADPENTLRALQFGADDYIIKPFGARELLARATATIENARLRSDAAAARGRASERLDHDRELRKLINDLRAAQRRVAAARDAERRRMERDLHDGAQQRLISLRLELGLLEERVETDPTSARARLEALGMEIEEALEELRELAHGLYPPLLASDGLAAALTSAARRFSIPVAVEATQVLRAPRSIESAAYFCCLEALQNVAKHGGPGVSVTVHLRTLDGELEFRISDDGEGFDPKALRPGQGLINLRDRVESLGGEVEVRSSPGGGATVLGRIPLP